jgi:hypothetical protein
MFRVTLVIVYPWSADNLKSRTASDWFIGIPSPPKSIAVSINCASTLLWSDHNLSVQVLNSMSSRFIRLSLGFVGTTVFDERIEESI